MATDLARAARRSPVSRSPTEVAVWFANPAVGSPRGGVFGSASGGCPELASFGAHHGAPFVIWGAVVACVVRDNLPDFAAICRDLQ